MSFIDDYGWVIIFGTIVLFTFLTMLFYSKKDKYDPEPAGRLLWGFFLGILSVIPAIFLSIIGFFIVGGNSILLSILVAPIVEEIAKLMFVIWLARSDNFDGPLDGLVYGAMVGAGFAAAENILYGLNAVIEGGLISGITLTTFRSLTQIIGHPLYTGLAGVGVGEWKVGLETSKYNKIWRSMVFHGFWNLSASLSPFSLSILALGCVVVLNIVILRRELKRTLNLDKDAYERGYYEQKHKMMEMKRQGIRPPTHQPWQMPSGQTQTPIQPFQDQVNPVHNPQFSDVQPAKPIGTSLPKFCKNCGNKRLDGDKFCRNCGFQMVR